MLDLDLFDPIHPGEGCRTLLACFGQKRHRITQFDLNVVLLLVKLCQGRLRFTQYCRQCMGCFADCFICLGQCWLDLLHENKQSLIQLIRQLYSFDQFQFQGLDVMLQPVPLCN